MQTKPFDAAACLRDEEDIRAYLEVAAEEAAEFDDQSILITALETAAKARGMMRVAEDAGVSRESLYRSLAPDAKPRFETVVKVLDALGMQIALVPKRDKAA